MITDEKMVELVTRAQDIVRKGFGRMAQFPEHQAIESPVIAVVLAELIREEVVRAGKENYRLES